jgi:regulator of cell morphogenesis and NO signaling
MTSDRSLAELAAEIPSAARIFHQHRLDYCCGGKQSLEEACEGAGLSAKAVLEEIQASTQAAGQVGARWAELPLGELVQPILEQYHEPLKAELPRLVELAQRVERAHADKPDRPVGLAAFLSEVRAAVDGHLAKEEQILFPLIVSGRGHNAYMPVQVMIQEHEDHGASLRRIRALTGDLKLPDYACATWRELYRALAQLEVELMDHIHLENNILFPRALAS